MDSAEEEMYLGEDVRSDFFCYPQSPTDDVELQKFMSCKSCPGAFNDVPTADSFIFPDDPSLHEPRTATFPQTSGPRSHFAEAPDVKAFEPPEDSISRTFTSFGENGTTASVSTYGDIMQITRYLGVGKSGFFCADLPDQWEPWFVERRARDLLDYTTDEGKGMGLAVPEELKDKPRLDFVHDRWPRYRGETEHLSILIEHTVRDGTVIQKYSIEKHSEDCMTFEIECKGIGIRKMEWLDGLNHFNDLDPPETFAENQIGNQTSIHKSSYQGICGPNKCSFNIIHHFDGLVKEKEDQKDQINHGLEEEMEASSSVPSVASAHDPKISAQGCGEPLGKKNDKKEEPPTSSETRDPAAVGLVMAVFVNNEAQHFADDGSMFICMSEETKSLEITVAYRLQLLSSNSNGWKSSLISASEICKPPMYRTPNHNPISFSRNRNVDFIIRRNLEHILSVCAINTATKFVWNDESRLFMESIPKKPAFALTCGDFAGHHIVSSASFFAFKFLLEISKFLKRSTSMEDSKQQPHGMSVGHDQGTSIAGKKAQSQTPPNAHLGTETELVIESTLSNESRLYVHEQLDRIFNVCKGHMTWTFQNAWKEGRAHFGGNHWASGDPIIFPYHWSSARRSPPSLADTPFQIIKAFEFARCWSDDKMFKDASKRNESEDLKTGQPMPTTPVLTQKGTLDDVQKPGAENRSENNSPKVEPVPPQEAANDTIKKHSVDFDPWKFARSLVKSKIKPWVDDLALRNKRTRFAFSRSAENGVSIFRLEDHVWIWMALRCLEDFDLDSELTPTPSALLGYDQSRKITSKDAQKNILRRFTVDEPFLKQRLLATSRTVRESRFLFRSRDTALFYAMKNGFFGSDQSKPTPWMNTIDMQRLHEHNDDTKWESPLRYGLAMIMSSNRQWQINHKSANKMLSDAATVLLYSARSNGLFPGEFDQESKEPAIFSEQYYRNSHWSSCFELPYILWVYGKSFMDENPDIKPDLIIEKKRGSKFGDQLQGTPPTASYVNENTLASHFYTPESAIERSFYTRAEPGALNKTDPGTRVRARETQAAIDTLTVKKTMPFNDFIDQKSVVEPSDDWLYSFPDFLDFDPDVQSCENVWSKIERLLDFYRPDRDFSTGSLLADAAKSFQKTVKRIKGANPTLEHVFPSESDERERGVIVDVPNSKQRRKGSLAKFSGTSTLWDPTTNAKMWMTLKKMRSEQMAKKRIVWLLSPNKETALLCYLGSPESQHDAIVDFFDRHHSYEHYFSDDTIAVENIWETELHLPFYQLLGDEDNTNARAEFLPPRREITSPALSGKRIVRAAIGFRFLGDFLDRYWTCHIVECIPGSRYDDEDLGWKISQMTNGSGTWKQRKVLELVIFDMMLSEVLNGVTGILQALFNGEKRPLALSEFTRNDYLYLQERSQSQRYILQLLEEDLKESLEQIESWKNREVDRGQERPRWTKKDERKYRGPINKMLRSNERKIRKLKSHQTHIQSLRAELLNTQQQFRDDLNFLGAEDIKYFTYVTVVFLPLGFAASLFSMSQTPSGVVLISMVVTAMAALLLTVLALVSVKNIAGFVSAISNGFNRAISNITSTSVLYQHYHHQNGQPSTTTKVTVDQSETAGTNWILPDIAHSLWLCWFWVAYITQELPGRQFERAYKIWKMANPCAREGVNQSTFKRWVLSALSTGAWLLQVPLKLGILFAITLTGSICWLAVGFKRLYLTLKHPLAFVIAVVFVPVFVLSYVINLIWLNIYDTVLWSARKNSMESKAGIAAHSLPEERTEEAPTGVTAQQSSRSRSEKNARHEESLERFLVYSKATRPFQKHEPDEVPKGQSLGDRETAIDMRKAMRSIFDQPPLWPGRKRAFGPFSV